ncbi:MAG: VWA domain-containing protein [Bacilli bacterium]|nr:VWA domain-containing protein [Bacilli bacterium]
MRLFPIIPIWLMLIISLIMIIYILIRYRIDYIKIGIIILLFIINMRIMIPKSKMNTENNNLDVLFVIDSTISMVAEDYNGTNPRLDGVKKDVKKIIDELSGARFSVITFSNSAKIISPYTRDINLAYESIEIIKPIREFDARGSSLNTPLDTILKSLKNSEKKEDRVRILFFISDGEITNNDTLTSYKKIKSHIQDGAVLGYGTKKGGRMKVYDILEEKQTYLQTHDNNYNKIDAISKIDEDNLKQIAKDMNIPYVHMEKTSDLDDIIDSINKKTISEYEVIDKKTYDDIYFYFIIPLLILLLLELNKYRRKLA